MKPNTELVLDSSEEVISLDKDNLYFTLDPSNVPDGKGLYGVSEFIMTVKNLTGSFVAIRTKTTKKDVYAVNPTYGVIYPNGSLEIKFAYHIKDLNEDPKKHKFKFEGILIESLVEDKKIREIFDNCILNRTKVKGTAIKREVVFNFAKAKQSAPSTNPTNPFAEPPLLNQANPSEINADTVEKPNPNILLKQPANDKQAESQLQDMKMELHKYKNHLNSLIDTHKNLKNRVEMEKSKDIQSNLNITVTSSEEKQISRKLTIILFAVSVILGFYLSL